MGEVHLYAIAPYAYEYVRKSTQTGGVSGLATSFAKEMIFSIKHKSHRCQPWWSCTV